MFFRRYINLIKNFWDLPAWLILIIYLFFALTTSAAALRFSNNTIIFLTADLLIFVCFFRKFFAGIIGFYYVPLIFLTFLEYVFHVNVDCTGIIVNFGVSGNFFYFCFAPVYDLFYGNRAALVLFVSAKYLFSNLYCLLLANLYWMFAFTLPQVLACIIFSFPLIAAVTPLLFGNKLGNKYSGYFSTLLIFISGVASFLLWIVHPIFTIIIAKELLIYTEARFQTVRWWAQLSWDQKMHAWDQGYNDFIEKVIKLFEEQMVFYNSVQYDYNVIQVVEKGIVDPQLYFNFYKAIDFCWLQADWSFKFDNLALVMLTVIFTISFFVHMYSIWYMEQDHSAARFFGYLSLFTFFMAMLVLSANFFVFYVAWEGVGISSFLLIGFWHTRAYASKAAIKALFVNKFGDIFLFLAMVIIANNCKSLDFNVVFPLIPTILAESEVLLGGYNYIDLISLFLLLAALIKSAQLFFHIWLADAMEGPTPVSALLHAATMVTAGIFLIIRCSFIFEYSPVVLQLLVYISVGSIISIGLVGLSQHDIKKIIAYSTCSQLGFMFLACGLSGYNIALFHFFNHAFFKALLFLSAGVLIHNLNNEQDIRKMGGLLRVFPFTYVSFLIGSLSMVGFPFFSGYYSKDAIIMLAYARLIDNDGGHYVLYYLILFSLVITCLYSFKIIFYVFLGDATNISNCLRGKVKENISFWGAAPIFCLSLLSITSGFFFKDYFIGAGSNYLFESSILTLHDEVKYVMFFKEQKIILLFLLIVSYILCIIYCYYINSSYYKQINFYFNNFLYKIYCFFNRKSYFDELYNIFLTSALYRFGYNIYKLIDKGLLEVFGPSGIKFLLRKAAGDLKKFLYSGLISNQMNFVLWGVVILGIIFFITK